MKIKVKDTTRFNELVIMKGFTKSAYGKENNLSNPITIQMTNGDRNPSPKTAKRIAEVLECEWTGFPTLVYLIDDKHAVSTNGGYINLYGVEELADEPGTYIRTWHSVAPIGVGDDRTVAGLERVVQALKVMSAFILLKEHYNADWSTSS